MGRNMLSRSLAFLLPVALGGLVFLSAGKLASQPPAKEKQVPPTPVRVIKVKPVPLMPRLTGYGVVAPAREWRGVARIESDVLALADKLAVGALVKSGELLVTLDATEQALLLAQIDAQTAALSVRTATTEQSLKVARADLTLAETELARQTSLQKRGVATATQVDSARRQSLSARAKLTELENQLALTAAEVNVLEAQRKLTSRALDYATLRAPFDARIVALDVAAGQYVSRGQSLLTAEGLDAVDIEVQLPGGQAGPVLRQLPQGSTMTDLTAEVRLTAGGHQVSWPARVDRVGEAIDARTQSSTVFVRVDDPQAAASPGQRPPLRRNMFVEVVLSAPPRDALVAPITAVQDGQVWVVTEAGELARQPVTTGYTLGGVVVIDAGLNTGDMLVISDLPVAMPGMRVKPVPDKATLQRLQAEASGSPTAGSQP